MSPVIMVFISKNNFSSNLTRVLRLQPELLGAINLFIIKHFVEGAKFDEVFVFWFRVSSWLCQIDIGSFDLFVSDFATILFEMLQVVFIGHFIFTAGILTLKLEAVEDTLLNLVEIPDEFSASTFFEALKIKFRSFSFIVSPIISFFAVIKVACSTNEGLTLRTLDGLDNNTVTEHTNEVLEAI